MPSEIYDIFDESGAKIGTADWIEVHEKGLLHQTASVLIFKDNSRSEMLLQQRSAKMHHSPGLWQHAAGGHIAAGETPDQGIMREIHEEIFCDRALPHLDVRRITMVRNNDFPGNHELLHLYELIYPGPFFPSDEVAALQWMPMTQVRTELHNSPGKFTRAFHNIIAAYDTAAQQQGAESKK